MRWISQCYWPNCYGTPFWVQYREEVSGSWTDLHPAFHKTPQFEPSFETVYVDTVPDTLQHRFRFQVFIEHLGNGKLTVNALGDAWERPTANMNAQPLVFTNVPDSLADHNSLKFSVMDALKNARWFVPTFQGGTMSGSRYFDLMGNLIDPMAAGSAAAGIVKTVGDLFSKALGGLDEGAAPQLTAQWFEFTFIAPDGSERKYRRTTFDRIGEGQRSSGKAITSIEPPTAADLAPLLTKHTFMLATDTVPHSLAFDKSLEHMVAQKPLIESLAHGGLQDASSGAANMQPLKTVPTHWPGHLSLYATLDRAADLHDGPLYRSGPSFVIHREGPNASEALERAVDIVQNPRRAFSRDARGVVFNPAAVLKAGVWETALEGASLPPQNEPRTRPVHSAERRPARSPSWPITKI